MKGRLQGRCPQAALWGRVCTLSAVFSELCLSDLSAYGLGKLINEFYLADPLVVRELAVAAVLAIVSARVEGFAFIYFSNAEVLQEIQTPANISSAHGAIANIVFLAITAVVGIIGAFFSTRKANG